MNEHIYLSLLVLFRLANELPQDAYLLVLVLIEVEPIPLSLLDLRQVVIQCLLGDIDHARSILQGHLFPHSDPRIQLPPSKHLLDHVLDLPLLQPAAFEVVIPFFLGNGLTL